MKIKKILFVIIFFVTLVAPAQDIIYRIDKKEIKSKIIEVLEYEVKYKKYEFLDGPTYSMSKSEIYMIVYKNGQKEMFENQEVKKAEKTENNSNNSNQKKVSSSKSNEKLTTRNTSDFDIPKKSMMMMDLGVTIKNFSEYNIPNIIYTTEGIFWDNIGVGGHVGMNTISSNINEFNIKISSNTSTLAFGVRGNYYLNSVFKINPDKIQIYAGLSLIYTNVTIDTSSNSTLIPSSNTSASSTDVLGQTGIRYFFTKNIGINAEIMFQDGSNFKVGLSYSLFPKKG